MKKTYNLITKVLFYFSLLLSAISLHGQGYDTAKYERHWKKDMKKVRIMSYNIFNGFDWGKDIDRENRLVEWVKLQDPEILGLQELCGFDKEKLQKLAKRWGHPYAEIVKADGYPVGITSKKPIVVKKKIIKDCGHGLIHAQTYGFNILVTHLNPSSSAIRGKEAAKISRYIQDNELDRCVLMGDLNSHSPMDADYMEAHSTKLLSNYNSENLLDGDFDYSVISQFLAIPLIDVCRKYVAPDKRTSFPTPILMYRSRHPEVHKKTCERLDYLFCSPDLMSYVVDGFIFNGSDNIDDSETDYLSDHYPIAIDLVIDSKFETK